MGKHNGKARRTGLPVGRALEHATQQSRRPVLETSQREQSILEQEGIDALLAMGALGGGASGVDQGRVKVLSSNVTVVENSNSKKLEGREVEDVVRIPRRPKWTTDQTSDQLDQNERNAFLNWRRRLAGWQERMPDALLTPFEKNLEVWRQLWRVLERSSIVVQVVDARHPLLYYTEDLVSYAKELHSDVEHLILLNKADLVNLDERKLWADYFQSKHLNFAFWSAKNSEEEISTDSDRPSVDSSIQILNTQSFIQLLKKLSRRLSQKEDGKDRADGKVVIGLVGYPNVGKSSTINALYGKKKTPVASTPGRTKHFQTLDVDEDICLCDCPGLVFPAFANSKSEMVASGILPVDRLVDVVAPVGYILSKTGMQLFLNVYNLAVGWRWSGDVREDAVHAIAVLARSRGWLKAAGLPDQTKTGRQIIKDYINGKIPHCELPPGHTITHEIPSEDALGIEKEGMSMRGQEIDEAEVERDILLASCLGIQVEDGKRRENRRAAHKFHKKPPRKKGNRGRQYDTEGPVTSTMHVKGHGAGIDGFTGSHYL